MFTFRCAYRKRAKQHLPCCLISKMVVDWICMLRKKICQRIVRISLIQSYQSSSEYIVLKSKNKCPGRLYLYYYIFPKDEKIF